MNVTLFGKVDGWRGTLRTVREMERLVDKGKKDTTVQYIARQIARKYKPKDYVGQANALHKFVRDYIHYVRDPIDVELIHAPLFTLKARAGDCDDQAILLRALAEAIGFKTRFKTIKADANHPDEFSHIYSEVHIPGRGWLASDTIVEGKALGWEAGNYPSKVWGGSSMFGALGADAAATTAAKKPSFWDNLKSGFTNAGADVGNILGQAFAQQTGQWLNVPVGQQPTAPTVAAPAQASGSMGWLLPAGLGIALLGGVGYVLMKKKRR